MKQIALSVLALTGFSLGSDTLLPEGFTSPGDHHRGPIACDAPEAQAVSPSPLGPDHSLAPAQNSFDPAQHFLDPAQHPLDPAQGSFDPNQGAPSILERLGSEGKFRRLVTAMESAGLLGTLAGDGPFTLFAPTDEAFAALPRIEQARFRRPANKSALNSILSYHLVSGSVAVRDAVRLGYLDTVNGQRVYVSQDLDSRAVQVGQARLASRDIACSNGVIHVLEGVLMPNTKDLVGTIAAADSFRDFSAAIKAGGLVEKLKEQGPFTILSLIHISEPTRPY